MILPGGRQGSAPPRKGDQLRLCCGKMNCSFLRFVSEDLVKNIAVHCHKDLCHLVLLPVPCLDSDIKEFLDFRRRNEVIQEARKFG